MSRFHHPPVTRNFGSGTLGSATIERLLFLLRPARLGAAAIGTAAVAAAGLATTAAVGALGAGDSALALVVGGVVCLNTLLFFTPGTLGRFPRRIPLCLAANLVPLVATGWLLREQSWAADVLLILLSFAAVLMRALGPLASTLALTVVINVLIALLLGGGPGFLVIAAISAAIGSVIGPIADLLTVFVLARFGRFAERHFLTLAAILFLEEAARRWKDGWDEEWVEPHAARFAAIADDFTLGARKPDPLIAQLIRVIGRAGHRLYAARSDLPRELFEGTSIIWTELAQRLETKTARGAITKLRAVAMHLAAEGEHRALASCYALAVVLLLGELLGKLTGAPQQIAIEAGSREPLSSRFRARIGALELRIASQTVLAVAIALVVGHLMHAERPYWIVLTTLMLTSASFGETLRKSYERLLGTVGGFVVGELLWYGLAEHGIWLNVVKLLAIAGLFFVRAGAYRWMLFFITLLLALLLNEAGEAALLVDGRLLDTLVGAAIVVVVTRLFLPVRARRVAESREKVLLHAIARRLRMDLPRRDAAPLHAEVAGALVGLRTASDAELLEAGFDRTTQREVARRRGAAERIAGAFLALDSLPRSFQPRRDTAVAIEATASFADAVARNDRVPPRPDIITRMHALAAEAKAAGTAPALELDLRMLLLLGALGRAITALADARADEPGRLAS